MAYEPFTHVTGVISAGNSTSAALGAGGVFTGATENNGYNEVLVSVKTDQTGTMSVQFSPDGINWDSQIPFVIRANENQIHRFVKGSRYFRIVFTNDATPQSFLRLTTSYGDFSPLTSALNSIITPQADALTVRNLDAELMMRLGLMADYTIVNKYGVNPDVDTATVPEDVWPLGGAYTGFVAAADEMTVVSSDPADTGTLTITYLPSTTSKEYEEVDVVLNGTTPVNTGISAYRCHRAHYNSGGAAANVGNITIRQRATPANVYVYILAGQGQTSQATMTVPYGNTGILKQVVCDLLPRGSSGNIEGCIYIKEFGKSPRLARFFDVGAGGQHTDVPYGGIPLPALTDVTIRITVASTNKVR